jgi:kynureninase
VTQVTPCDPAARGCQLSLRVRTDGRGLCERLSTRGVIVDFRPPDILRAAPVPLYNSFHDVWRLVDEIDRAIAGR